MNARVWPVPILMMIPSSPAFAHAFEVVLGIRTSEALEVKATTYDGTPVKDLVLELTLEDNASTLARLTLIEGNGGLHSPDARCDGEAVHRARIRSHARLQSGTSCKHGGLAAQETPGLGAARESDEGQWWRHFVHDAGTGAAFRWCAGARHDRSKDHAQTHQGRV